MINLRNIFYTTNNRPILKNISFNISHKEMVFLTGPSGVGKTTLLKLISGIDTKFLGDIIVDKHHIKELDPDKLILFQNNVGKVLSTPLLLDNLTTEENLAIPLEILGYSKKNIAQKVKAISHLFKITHLLKERTNELSQGEQQLVNIVRAIINKPAILLADEPTSNLDSLLASDIITILESFQALGITIIIATHDLRLIAKAKKRTLIINDGKLAADVSADDAHKIAPIYHRILQRPL